MNRYSSRLAVLVTTVWCFGCNSDSRNTTPVDGPTAQEAKANNRVAETWMAKPQTEWPQLVLTNHADFKGHSSLRGASSFLIKTSDERVLAATAAHLLGSAGGVDPLIPIEQLNGKIQCWRMFPRTMPDSSIEVSSLGVEGLEHQNLDWLILSIKKTADLPAQPLQLRKEPVDIGETVYLIGCPYSEQDCKQTVYSCVVTERAHGNLFRYDLDSPVDVRGFSGAPIIDVKGYVVGVMMIWFNPKMAGDNFLEAGGQDTEPIYDLLHSED